MSAYRCSIYFCSIPIPLSETTILDIPPSSILIVILLALASIEFSINSFTTATGLSITSPAAISFIISGGNKFISFAFALNFFNSNLPFLLLVDQMD